MEDNLTPKTANTFNKICSLKRDNRDFGKKHAVVISEKNISIHYESEDGWRYVSIPKGVFNRMIKFYETGK